MYLLVAFDEHGSRSTPNAEIRGLMGRLKRKIEARTTISAEERADRPFREGQCIHCFDRPRFARTCPEFIRIGMWLTRGSKRSAN